MKEMKRTSGVMQKFDLHLDLLKFFYEHLNIFIIIVYITCLKNIYIFLLFIIEFTKKKKKKKRARRGVTH